MYKNKVHLTTHGSGEDKKILDGLLQLLNLKRKTFVLPSPESSVVLLLSGGLDSISLWYMLLHKYHYHVYPFYLRRSSDDAQQRSISHYSTTFKKEFPSLFHTVKIIETPEMFNFRDTKIRELYRNPDLILANSVEKKDTNQYEIQLISNPTRLGHYLSSATDYLLELQYIHKTNVSTIFLGLVPEDRLARESTLTVLTAYTLAISASLGDYNIRFLAPFDKNSKFYIPRKDLILYALHHGIDLNMTWSCVYFDRKTPCGKCNNCINRKELLEGTTIKNNTLHTMIKNIGSHFKSNKKKKSKLISLHLKSIITASSDIQKKRVGEKTFLLKQNAEIIELNSTGAEIWEQFSEDPIHFDDLMSRIHAFYPEIPKENLKKDIIEFITTCHSFEAVLITQSHTK